MAEYEPGGALARRHPGSGSGAGYFAPGLDEPLVTYAGGAKTWHVADPGSSPGQAERGSVVAATDAAGMVVTSWGYGPHGEPDARGMAPTFGFTGALTLPQIGLTSMRARVYSHRLGRFLQPDPIGQAGGLNLYDYVGGDPVNGWDPWGLGPVSLPEIIITARQDPIAPGAGGLALSVIGGVVSIGGLDRDAAERDPYCNIAVDDPECAIVVSKWRVLPAKFAAPPAVAAGAGAHEPRPAYCYSSRHQWGVALNRFGPNIQYLGVGALLIDPPAGVALIALGGAVDFAGDFLRYRAGNDRAIPNLAAAVVVEAAGVHPAAGVAIDEAGSTVMDNYLPEDPCR